MWCSSWMWSSNSRKLQWKQLKGETRGSVNTFRINLSVWFWGGRWVTVHWVCINYVTCMNYGLNALSLAGWAQTHLQIQGLHHLHPGCPGSPLSHTQLCFVTVAAQAERQKDRCNKESVEGARRAMSFCSFLSVLYLGNEIIPNTEIWRNKILFKNGSRFLFHYDLRTGRSFTVDSRLFPGCTAGWQNPESSWFPVQPTWGGWLKKKEEIS